MKKLKDFLKQIKKKIKKKKKRKERLKKQSFIPMVVILKEPLRWDLEFIVRWMEWNMACIKQERHPFWHDIYPNPKHSFKKYPILQWNYWQRPMSYTF